MFTHMFECKRCHYKTGTKQSLVKHLLRKKPCCTEVDSPELDVNKLYFELTGSDIVRHKCPFCCYEASTVTNLNVHKRTCKYGKDQVPTDEALSKFISEGQCEKPMSHNAMMQEIKALRQELESLKNKPTNSSQTTNNIENLQINQYNMHPFGKEDMSHIDQDFLTTCLLNTSKGVANLLSRIHFDPDTPQNNNIRVKSKKQNLLEKVVEDGTWEQCDKNNTLDEMIRKGYKILFAHFLATKEESDNVKENEFALQNWFTDLSSRKGDEYYRLRRDLFVIVLNNTIYFLGKL